MNDYVVLQELNDELRAKYKFYPLPDNIDQVDEVIKKNHENWQICREIKLKYARMLKYSKPYFLWSYAGHWTLAECLEHAEEEYQKLGQFV